MKTGQELYIEHMNRFKAAIALEKPDRVLVVVSTNIFAPKHVGVKMSDFIKDPLFSAQTILKSMKLKLADFFNVSLNILTGRTNDHILYRLIEFDKNKFQGLSDQEMKFKASYSPPSTNSLKARNQIRLLSPWLKWPTRSTGLATQSLEFV